ncbi:MAG TPA: PqqD family protein [Anaerolineae bacterium]|nr:PqqD family protein [Anaerolineae bacterium]
MSILQKYPQPHPQTAGRIIDGEAILILSDVSEINVLNEVGSRIFELSTGTNSTDDIIQTLVTEYNGDHQAITADVTHFLEEMVKNNVIILSDTPAS